jgi:hypothetical protein
MTSAYRSADSTCPAHGAFPVTPSDATVIQVTRALYVGVSGNINVRMADGQTVLFSNVPVGIFPIQVDMVLATSTTATTIVALN